MGKLCRLNLAKAVHFIDHEYITHVYVNTLSIPCSQGSGIELSAQFYQFKTDSLLFLDLSIFTIYNTICIAILYSSIRLHEFS